MHASALVAYCWRTVALLVHRGISVCSKPRSYTSLLKHQSCHGNIDVLLNSPRCWLCYQNRQSWPYCRLKCLIFQLARISCKKYLVCYRQLREGDVVYCLTTSVHACIHAYVHEWCVHLWRVYNVCIHMCTHVYNMYTSLIYFHIQTWFCLTFHTVFLCTIFNLFLCVVVYF